MCVCMFVCVRVCVGVRACVCVCARARAHTRTHVRTQALRALRGITHKNLCTSIEEERAQAKPGNNVVAGKNDTNFE